MRCTLPTGELPPSSLALLGFSISWALQQEVLGTRPFLPLAFTPGHSWWGGHASSGTCPLGGQGTVT